MRLEFVAVGLGAACGAWLRWGLAAALNGLVPRLPLGTLAANLVGGYLVGLAVAYFSLRTDLDPAWRLLVITGFLGGLTTFSTFSAEVVGLLEQGDWGRAALLALMHLGGSLALTALGFATLRRLAA